jgi:hypothetical protein
MSATLHARALARAAEILGGTDELCAYLEASTFQLELWMQGRATPPDAVFLRVADLLNETQLRALHAPRSASGTEP